MGIPKLSHHLASLSESATLGGQHESSEGFKSVVIDGPALVYHVYSTLISRINPRVGVIDRQPTCNEVSVAVMMYLVLLKVVNVDVRKIYFDGALPLHKRDTRLSRLERSRKQLEGACKTTRKGHGLVLGNRACSIRPGDLFQGPKFPGNRSPLPENAFMVSAVIEDLMSRWNLVEIRSNLPENLADIVTYDSDYPWLDICEIVPGEADFACAALTSREHGLAILTSDSDLVVFNLGPSSTVIFLNTIYTEYWCDEDPSRSIIRAMHICPASISNRLGIHSLPYLAHELNVDSRAGLGELIRRAKRAYESTHLDSTYVEFMRQYDLRAFTHNLFNASFLQGFDVRLSELFAQIVWSGEFLDQLPRIYLPFLQEDHSRRCGWAEGSRIRRLAYSLIDKNKTLDAQYPSITECTRRGTRFCFDEVTLYSREVIKLEVHRLLDGYKHIQNNHPESRGSPLFWRIYALAEIYSNTEENHTYWPDKRDLGRFLGFEKTYDNVGWEEIHALAQTQSVLYSLRILFQIIRIIPHNNGAVSQLYDCLSTLPSLRILMGTYREVRDEYCGG
ncbi:XPG domain containing-domain-containing protein [Talaromyces proteolyticus]|uniref:XPG domain containing-domain-containing protein n=1 Tax=Talaromyces proteolyticus TaxID=1131652 RepID=A0AAD4KE54_9EURO|nr:XPG domain containing-domain-containing protein [Talaromyces proteolyticus]KAH8689790.1 XPG domain containing-domain-containing protein [Talaromyces proteolyticus]